MMRNFTLNKLTHMVWIFFALFLSVLFILLSQRSYFSDSEIWLLTLSQKAFSVGDLISIYYKWPFHALTFLTSHWATSESSAFLSARLAMAVIALLSALMTSRLSTLVFKNSSLFWPTFIITLSSTLFFNQGFRIRADTLAYAIHIFTLLLALHLFHKNPNIKQTFWLSILNLLLLMTTPKFVFFFIAQFCMLLLLSLKHQKRQFFTMIWTSHLLPVGLISMLILLTPLFPSLNFVQKAIAAALDFYLKSFDDHLGTPPLFSLQGFYYLIEFIKGNLILSSLIYLWLMLATIQLINRRKSTWEQSDFLFPFHIYNILLLVMMLFHNQKLPFFLAFCLAPIAAHSFCFLFNFLYKKSILFFKWITSGLVIVLSLSILTYYQDILKSTSNKPQMLLVQELEKYLNANPEIKVYDIIGINPRKTKIFAFVGPSEVAKKLQIIHQIQTESPDIILFVYKFTFLEPQIKDFLTSSMIPLGSGVWIKGQILEPMKTPQYFTRTTKINGQSYWVLPRLAQKYFYNLSSGQLMNSQILNLDYNFKLTELTPQYIGIPFNTLSFGVSHVPPLQLSFSPFHAFRFDRGT